MRTEPADCLMAAIGITLSDGGNTIKTYRSHNATASVQHRNSKGDCVFAIMIAIYRKTHNISRTLVGNKIVDNSDVVGASPVGAAPTTSSFWT